MKKLYLIYDMKYYEQCVGVYENVQSIANKFDMAKDSVLTAISKRTKIKNRYEVRRFKYGENVRNRPNNQKYK